jgi:hypothetical protein
LPLEYVDQGGRPPWPLAGTLASRCPSTGPPPGHPGHHITLDNSRGLSSAGRGDCTFRPPVPTAPAGSNQKAERRIKI